MTATKIIASQPPIIKPAIKAEINIKGARTAMRMSIINAICTLEISVVRRVTKDDEENASIVVNENF